MDTCEDLTGLLNGLGLRWAYAGAVAANRYRASPRHTEDVDLLCEWTEELGERLQVRGWDLAVAADPGEGPHLVRARKGARFDLMIAATEYQQIALERARDHWLAPEDVIVHKLIAWRERDRDDISSILASGVHLDIRYVEEWADAWGVADRWREAGGS